jgi:hypothetical protein
MATATQCAVHGVRANQYVVTVLLHRWEVDVLFK